MGWLIIIGLLILIIWLLRKFYFVKYDVVIAYTGGLGSGKSLNAVKVSKRLLMQNRAKVKKHNKREKIKKYFNKKYEMNLLEMPLMYSNIPIRISKNEWSAVLTPELLLLQNRLIPLSVTFIDECSSFINQFEYKNPNCNTLDEFFRLYRHYTGVNGVGAGYIVLTDQNSNLLEIHIRYRVNTVFNLMHFRKFLFFFYTVRIRNISLTEDIKTLDNGNTEDNMKTLFGILPFRKMYDTYCYSDRIKTVPFGSTRYHKKFKTNKLLKCPSYKFSPKTTSKEVEELNEENKVIKL